MPCRPRRSQRTGNPIACPSGKVAGQCPLPLELVDEWEASKRRFVSQLADRSDGVTGENLDLGAWGWASLGSQAGGRVCVTGWQAGRA